MEEPVYIARARFEALRSPRGFAAKAEGLWCAGELSGLSGPCVAVVGTRAATGYGRRLARDLGRDLGSAGCTILSGLALGIDTCAHEGALEAGAPTIGVLGGGHRRFFPRRNRALAERMLAGGGAVLSPWPPDEPAKPGQFLERNGVVAALADAVVVVEAPARSGALNTAGWAAGRVPVLAIPGDVDRPHAAGCLALIRDGATLARGARDVLEALNLPHEPLPLVRDRTAGLDPLAQRVVALLAEGERDLDAIVDACDAPASSVMACLTLLEIEDIIERRGAARYARR